VLHDRHAFYVRPAMEDVVNVVRARLFRGCDRKRSCFCRMMVGLSLLSLMLSITGPYTVVTESAAFMTCEKPKILLEMKRVSRLGMSSMT
jgi:hypothetical protein